MKPHETGAASAETDGGMMGVGMAFLVVFLVVLAAVTHPMEAAIAIAMGLFVGLIALAVNVANSGRRP